MSDQNDQIFDSPLGLIQVPKDTVEQDWKVNDGYISYSAELLRLSLLSITGIAALCLKLSEHRKFGDAAFVFRFGLLCLGLSTAFSVVHRYFAVDSMYYHIKHLRLTIRDRPQEHHPTSPNRRSESDDARSQSAADKRALSYRLSNWLLRLAAFFLLLGVLFSALSFGKL